MSFKINNLYISTAQTQLARHQTVEEESSSSIRRGCSVNPISSKNLEETCRNSAKSTHTKMNPQSLGKQTTNVDTEMSNSNNDQDTIKHPICIKGIDKDIINNIDRLNEVLEERGIKARTKFDKAGNLLLFPSTQEELEFIINKFSEEEDLEVKNFNNIEYRPAIILKGLN